MRRAALAAFGLAAAGPFAMLAYQIALGRQWRPDLPRERIHFLNYRMPDASMWLHRLLLVDLLWGVAFIAAVLLAPALRERFGRAFLPLVLAAQCAGLAAMVASPFPMDSDQFAYVYYGDLTLDGINPYPAYAHAIPLHGAERRIAVHWNDPPYVDRYGPAWTLGDAAVLASLRHAPAEAQARLLRALAAVAALGSTLLLALILRTRRRFAQAIAAFALDPLVLTATGNGGHNDIFLVFFGLLAFALAQRRAYELASIALATAVCVKFAYAPLLPALLAWTWYGSRSVLRVAASAVAFLVAMLLYGTPLGVRTSLGDPLLDFNAHHEPRITYWIWRAAAHLPHLHAIARGSFDRIVPLLIVASALGIAWYALRGRRAAGYEFALALLVLLLPYKIESWYAVMLAPLLLVPGRYAIAAFIAITLGCEFLQMRIFYATSQPYVELTGLVVLIGLTIVECARRSAGYARHNPASM